MLKHGAATKTAKDKHLGSLPVHFYDDIIGQASAGVSCADCVREVEIILWPTG